LELTLIVFIAICVVVWILWLAWIELYDICHKNSLQNCKWAIILFLNIDRRAEQNFCSNACRQNSALLTKAGSSP
jgi:hypothetical protein